MNQFFTTHIEDGLAVLSQEESQHLKVLRIREGDAVVIVDGKGKQYEGTLSRLHKKASEVTVGEMIRSADERPLIDIVIAPTKSNDRIEWFLEKATEIGIGHIYPIVSYHSERKVIKPERWKKITLSAMKQSLRLWLPEIHPLQSLDSLLNSALPHPTKCMAHLKTDQQHLKSVIVPSERTLVVIGPEGGFSDQEIALAEAQDYKSVTLGDVRYRTETAGVVVATIFNQL